MPQFTTVDVYAKNRLIKRTRGYDARAPFRDALANLEGDGVLEIAPEDGETLRKLKLNVARAGKEVNREVRYGETEEGTLLVWLETTTPRKRQRKARTQG